MKKRKFSSREEKTISELRQDMVSGEWVVIATGRAKRPHDFLKQKRARVRDPVASCPFEKLIANRVLVYSKDKKKDDGDWWIQVIPNKYPAFGKGVCAVFYKEGPYQWTGGVGFHEVVITRDHARSIGMMSKEETEFLIHAFQERYLALKDDRCVEYVSIFHNNGRMSGATITHPHSQIIAIPVVPPDIRRSVDGSRRFYRANRACVHCMILRYERKVKKRLIFENERFVVIAPYASKTAFETRVFPKFHSAHFEDMAPRDRILLADALRTALAKLFRGLNDPDYNFFLHTAPVRNVKDTEHYHWHFEIIPKTAIWAGFEIGTGIEISVISPERAAEFLRKVKVR